MTVVVAYLAGKGGSSVLHLAVEAARTLKTSLTVTTVVPRPWLTPSPARIDAEYGEWADQRAAASQQEPARCLEPIAGGVEIVYHRAAHRSVSGGLVDVVTELKAQVLVL